MRISIRLAILLSLGGCSGSSSGGSCKLDGAAYVGLVDVSKTDYLTSLFRGEGPSVGSGGLAIFVPSKNAGSLPQLLPDCSGVAKSGQCCYIAAPPDAGDGSSSGPQSDLSDWNVTVTDVSDPDAGSYSELDVFADGGSAFPGTGAEPLGSLRVYDWTGGDELLAQGDGVGTVGTFSGQIKAPLEFEGLSPNVFSDAGALSVGRDLPLSWTPGGASNVAIEVLDESTFGEAICTVPDNGSFTVPGSVLANFQSGDEGGVAVFRSSGSCAYSSNAAISILVLTQTNVAVAFQ